MKIIRARKHYQHVAKSSVLKGAKIHHTSVSLFSMSPPPPLSLASQFHLISSFLLTPREIFFHSHVSLLKGSSNNGNQNKPLSSGHNPGQVLSSLFLRVALETTSMLCSGSLYVSMLFCSLHWEIPCHRTGTCVLWLFCSFHSLPPCHCNLNYLHFNLSFSYFIYLFVCLCILVRIWNWLA